MKGFIYVWRATAYYMGVDEEANLVKDDFNRTKRLLNDIGIFVIIPAILNLNKVSLIMGKNVAEALDVDYHVAVYIGAKYLVFSPLAPSKREKNILVLLSLHIF